MLVHARHQLLSNEHHHTSDGGFNCVKITMPEHTQAHRALKYIGA